MRLLDNNILRNFKNLGYFKSLKWRRFQAKIINLRKLRTLYCMFVVNLAQSQCGLNISFLKILCDWYLFNMNRGVLFWRIRVKYVQLVTASVNLIVKHASRSTSNPPLRWVYFNPCFQDHNDPDLGSKLWNTQKSKKSGSKVGLDLQIWIWIFRIKSGLKYTISD